jgi:amino acid transporter
VSGSQTRSPVLAALAADRVGAPSVMAFVLSGVAVATVVAGVVTTMFAVTGLTAIPAAFLVVAAVLAIFAVGYVAMARHVRNSGVFYAYVTAGLGRAVGVAAAFDAVIAYHLLQIGLYGAFGPAAATFLGDELGWHQPWWVWSLIAWAVVGVLGVQRIDLNGKVTAVLAVAEIAVVAVLSVAAFTHPAGGHVDVSPLNPADLVHPGVGALLATALLGYVGFESSAVFAEESKRGARTVAVATYSSLALIVIIYGLASWALPVHYGTSNVAAVAQAKGPTMLFDLAGPTLATAANVLYLTSLFAAMVAFHNTTARYLYALGRDHVLPAGLRRTNRAGAPMVASLTQTTVALAVILVFAVGGWDPMVKLFFWGGTTGGAGILLLLLLTAVATVGFFARNPRGEPVLVRVLAPLTATGLLAVMVWLVVDNYPTLLGVAPGSAAARWLPALYPIAAGLGLIVAVAIRLTRPRAYTRIGADPAATPHLVAGHAVAAPLPGDRLTGEVI